MPYRAVLDEYAFPVPLIRRGFYLCRKNMPRDANKPTLTRSNFVSKEIYEVNFHHYVRALLPVRERSFFLYFSFVVIVFVVVTSFNFVQFLFAILTPHFKTNKVGTFVNSTTRNDGKERYDAKKRKKSVSKSVKK